MQAINVIPAFFTKKKLAQNNLQLHWIVFFQGLMIKEQIFFFSSKKYSRKIAYLKQIKQ